MQTIIDFMPWVLVALFAGLFMWAIILLGKKTVELEQLQKSHNLLLETTQNLTQEMISQRLKEMEESKTPAMGTGEFLTYLATFTPHGISTIADLIHLAYFKGWDLENLQPYFAGLDKGDVDFEEVINNLLGIDISGLTDKQITNIVWGIINGANHDHEN